MCARGKHELQTTLSCTCLPYNSPRLRPGGQRHAVPQQALTKVVAAQALRGAKEGANQVSAHQHIVVVIFGHNNNNSNIIIDHLHHRHNHHRHWPTSCSHCHRRRHHHHHHHHHQRRPPSTMKRQQETEKGPDKATGLAFSVRGERRRIIPAITMPKRSNYSRTSREGEGEREREKTKLLRLPCSRYCPCTLVAHELPGFAASS